MDAASPLGEPTIVTDTFLAGRRENGIVWVSIREGTLMTEASSRHVNEAIRELAEEIPCRILCDISARHDTDTGARRYGSSPEAIEVTERLALLVRSPVARMAGNAFMYARRPSYPVRLFTAEAEAVRWLLEAND